MPPPPDMPRKLTYEERMAKAQRERQAIDDRLKKLAEAQQKVRDARLLLAPTEI